jgi:large subunit ribosomal protein L17
MRHRVDGRHFSRSTDQRTALYRGLVTDLLRHERLTTTEAKAKEIRPMTEKIVTLGKRGDLHARRQVEAFVYDPKVTKKLFDEIAPRMADRPGGYLRITALDVRKGDGAKMATIEFVDLNGAVETTRPQRATAPASAPRRRPPVPARAASSALATAPAAEAPAPAAEPQAEAPEAEVEATPVAEVEETPAAEAEETTSEPAPAAEEDDDSKS